MQGLTQADRRAPVLRLLPPGITGRLGADRRPADWLADAALFGFAVALGGLAQAALWHSHGMLLDAIDLGAGVLACLALWWRRDYPVAVTLIAFGAAAFSRRSIRPPARYSRSASPRSCSR